MIYSANDEGVAALNRLGTCLPEYVSAISDEAERLLAVADEHADLLGVHVGDLRNALGSIQQETRDAAEPIEELSEKTLDTTDGYQEVIDRKRFSAGGSGASGAAGGTGGAGVLGGAAAGAMAGAGAGAAINSILATPSGGAAGTAGGTNAGVNSFFGGTFTPLLTTNQKTNPDVLDGQNVTVFDDPFGTHSERVSNQGSAYPNDGKGNGITGTCGLCACGTIINRAGGQQNEKGMIDHAIQNGQCSNPALSYDSHHKLRPIPGHRGGTSNADRMAILNDAGISSTDRTGSSLSDLAGDVESGHGVIVAVTASIYKPDWYGRYSHRNNGTHAIVIDSVVRDAKTGKIIEYVVTDSNGDSSWGAGVRIDAKTLERAHRKAGRTALVTDEVIW